MKLVGFGIGSEGEHGSIDCSGTVQGNGEGKVLFCSVEERRNRVTEQVFYSVNFFEGN